MSKLKFECNLTKNGEPDNITDFQSVAWLDTRQVAPRDFLALQITIGLHLIQQKLCTE